MLKDMLFAAPVEGTEDGFLVTLECGHKLATRNKSVAYDCLQCNPKPEREDVKLSTGRIVHHKREENGSQTAFIGTYDDQQEMTTEEWREYCEYVKFSTFKRKESKRV